MSKSSILISNTNLYPVEVHWIYNGRERIERIRDRAINKEIVFTCQEEKEYFMKVHKCLFDEKVLVEGKATERQMQKTKETKDKEETKKAKDLQNVNNNLLQAKVEEVTNGEIKDFKVEVEKGKK